MSRAGYWIPSLQACEIVWDWNYRYVSLICPHFRLVSQHEVAISHSGFNPLVLFALKDTKSYRSNFLFSFLFVTLYGPIGTISCSLIFPLPFRATDIPDSMAQAKKVIPAAAATEKKTKSGQREALFLSTRNLLRAESTILLGLKEECHVVDCFH